MLQDTLSSLQRLALGIVAAAVAGLLLGMNMALLPGMGNTLIGPVVTFISSSRRSPSCRSCSSLRRGRAREGDADLSRHVSADHPGIYGAVKPMPRESSPRP